MLVLARKAQEVVVVGGDEGTRPVLTTTVLEIAGGAVRLGFQADTSVLIHRCEVWQRIHPDSLPPCRAPPPVG
jgi:carbon storage regulator CsrA